MWVGFGGRGMSMSWSHISEVYHFCCNSSGRWRALIAVLEHMHWMDVHCMCVWLRITVTLEECESGILNGYYMYNFLINSIEIDVFILPNAHSKPENSYFKPFIVALGQPITHKLIDWFTFTPCWTRIRAAHKCKSTVAPHKQRHRVVSVGSRALPVVA